MLILRVERYVRQAYNLKVVGSNPTPATNRTNTFFNFKYVKKIFLPHYSRNRTKFLKKWAQYGRNEKSQGQALVFKNVLKTHFPSLQNLPLT